jgi:hypothetical protein
MAKGTVTAIMMIVVLESPDEEDGVYCGLPPLELTLELATCMPPIFELEESEFSKLLY